MTKRMEEKSTADKKFPQNLEAGSGWMSGNWISRTEKMELKLALVSKVNKNEDNPSKFTTLK